MAMFSCSLYVGTMIEYLTPSAMPPPFCFRSLSLFLVEVVVVVVLVVVVLVVGIRLVVFFGAWRKKSRVMLFFLPLSLLFAAAARFSISFFSRQKLKSDKPHTDTHTHRTSYSQASFKISSQYLGARTNALSEYSPTHSK